MFWLGIIVGVMLGYELNHYISKARKKGSINIFGFEITLSGYPVKNEKQPDPIQRKTAIKKSVNKKCHLCNGEDMFIAGTKNLIPCPECKRNANKFKKMI